MKIYHSFCLILCFIILSASTCNQSKTNEVDKEANEMRDAIEASSQEAKANEETDESVVEILSYDENDVPKACGKNLSAYKSNVDKLLALSKKRAQGDDSEETALALEKVNTKLKDLSVEIGENTEIFSNPDCAKAWLKMSTEYATYIRENLSEFIPEN